MSDAVLVAYATRYGSTREVAEAIATTLRERGLAVDVQPMRGVGAVEQYRAFVLGAALYVSHWHAEAREFLERHRATLVSRPVAVFALGPVHDDAKEFRGAREQFDKELAKFPWLVPTAIAVFGGKFDPARLGFPYTLIPALRNLPAADVRDWTAIRAWASDLATLLQPAASPSATG